MMRKLDCHNVNQIFFKILEFHLRVSNYYNHSGILIYGPSEALL